jgi:peptidyl-prolyl cis-trans isomerase B (cyclophilin B)
VVIIAAVVAFFLLKPPSKKKVAASPTPATSTAPGSITTLKKTPVACGGSLPAAAGTTKKTFKQPADEHLDPSKTYTWKLDTSCGEIDIALDVKDAPKTTNSIVFLTRQGFYDGTFFHRIAPGFVIQGGDPAGTGLGGPGYKVVEPVPTSFKYVKGTVAMAKSGAESGGTSGSQFFIVVSDSGGAGLTPDYADAGKVTSGSDVVDKIAATGTQDGPPDPSKGWTYINKATIVES